MDAAGAAVAVQLVGFGVAVLVLVVATVLCARHRRSDEGIGVRPLSTYKPSTGDKPELEPAELVESDGSEADLGIESEHDSETEGDLAQPKVSIIPDETYEEEQLRLKSGDNVSPNGGLLCAFPGSLGRVNSSRARSPNTSRLRGVEGVTQTDSGIVLQGVTYRASETDTSRRSSYDPLQQESPSDALYATVQPKAIRPASMSPITSPAVAPVDTPPALPERRYSFGEVVLQLEQVRGAEAGNRGRMATRARTIHGTVYGNNDDNDFEEFRRRALGEKRREERLSRIRTEQGAQVDLDHGFEKSREPIEPPLKSLQNSEVTASVSTDMDTSDFLRTTSYIVAVHGEGVLPPSMDESSA